MNPTYTVHSWQELTEAVASSRDQLDCRRREELWFRGVSLNNHSLIPSLYRIKHPDPDELEYDLFFEFLAKARTGDSQMSHWDVLFLMQHYRAPTRLLDWTEVLLVAVHFAVAYRKPDDTQNSRIFVMNPYAWNARHEGMYTWHDGRPSISDPRRDLIWPEFLGWDDREKTYYDFGELLVETEGVDWRYPIALYPPQRDARLSAQRGYFTIQGTDRRPLDEIAPDLIVAIDLTEKATNEARDQLKLAGVNDYSLFPDLEGLSRHLRTRYGIE